jgi:repressor LexA
MYYRSIEKETMHPIQIKILNVCRADNLGSLTLRKLGELIGESLPQKVLHHLIQLEKKGLIRYDRGNKTIEIVDKGQKIPSNLLTVPVMGTANCGEALSVADDRIQGYIQVSSGLTGNYQDGIIAVRASGDSMNKADIKGKSIDDGDYALVDSKYKDPKNGDYVVSIIDGMANIKKFFKDEENEQIVLISESSKNYPPIFIGMDEIESYLTCGRVIQVIKKPIF